MGKRRKRDENVSSLTKKQKKHLIEFGEQHPFYDQVSNVQERTQLVELPDGPKNESHSESEAESEEENANMYQQLLATLKHVSDEEEEEEDDEEEEVDDEDQTQDENEQLSSNTEEEDSEEEQEAEGDEDVQEEHVAKGEERGDDADKPTEPGDPAQEDGEEFTDSKHESKFSLEANFLEEDAEGQKNETAEPSVITSEDPFKKHIDRELEEDDVNQITANPKTSSSLKWPALGQMVFSSALKKVHPLKSEKETDLTKLYLRKPLDSMWPSVNSSFLTGESNPNFTALQRELFTVMNSYEDLYYPSRMATAQGEEVRHIYCLHALNHVLKANAQVLSNNAKKRDQKTDLDDEELRDQGLTRPKVLIVVPFRESALRVVQLFISLLEVPGRKVDVSNKKRFKDEFGSAPEDRPPNLRRPEDYEAIFAGNIDDHFRIGLSILQKSVRLYSPFYSSDIIIASPLGLRTIIGCEGEKKRDFDFLSSIEVLVIDQADIYLMQNWEHVLHLMSHLNLQPKDSHGVDFSRVRMWNLSNWAKYYRQTLLFSALQDPQINSIFNKHCFNYSGQVAVRNMPITGSISHVLVQLPHVFQRLEADSVLSVIDARFKFFTDKILPQYRDAIMSHTLIYIPSYFDFVRLRNYLQKEELNFTHICEYTDKPGIARARQFFLKGERQFLLVTERFHFYKRYTLKGIRNLIFYELPTYPHFYSEVCNMMKAWNRGEEATWTCTVLYSKYDAQRLAAVVGAERTAQMLQSKKNVHLFVTGENN
ncbi:LOW QUALITY PROTEIN: U3 small nucleolar RNA-associated protein 25 homolog [Bufo gargarizans]|uniref:LOW QUALITY PROTEIN: U3 small nucleolar RNA-associated protein 25 homolog n=1 Tax=Bufo gargarizans TaxID=30331 RepID=UPI001CF505D5|nr:LOW QUALITY PROTEIN: U3 small nucleolar RNA-associated protein 25 homolog [Bufo gargarizans]